MLCLGAVVGVWQSLIEPHYPKVGPQGGRRPFPHRCDVAHLLPAAVVHAFPIRVPKRRSTTSNRCVRSVNLELGRDHYSRRDDDPELPASARDTCADEGSVRSGGRSSGSARHVASRRHDRGCDPDRRLALHQERGGPARSRDALLEEGQSVVLRHEGTYRRRYAQRSRAHGGRDRVMAANACKRRSVDGRTFNECDEETDPFVRDGCRLACSGCAVHFPRRRSLPGAARDDHQSICSGQHFRRRGASHCTIAAGSAGTAIYRGEQGGSRWSGRCYGRFAGISRWLHAAGDGELISFRRGALQGAADRSAERLHPYRSHRQLSLVHRGAFEPPGQFDPGARRLRQECSRQVDLWPWQQPGAVDR